MCQNNQVPVELILAVATFGFVTSVTPGPNNTILFATGVNYGVKKAFPFLFGIMLGLSAILTAIGLGLGIVFVTLPAVYQVLKYLGFAYILFLAYSIIRSGYKPIEANSKLFGLFEATFFQFVNPKVWVVMPSFMASFIPIGASLWQTIGLVLVFLIVTFPGALAWAVFGGLLKNFMADSKKRLIFNWIAGLLLVASMVPVLFMG
jgi:threonine/homoserine/homoserine lactone efflux protein